jgi:hypothetical protein
LKTFENRREGQPSTRYAPRNPQKGAGAIGFPQAETIKAEGDRPKVLTQFVDSQFFHESEKHNAARIKQRNK